MTANLSKLGIEGVFASTSLSSGEDWRWQSYLLNVPLYYEMFENNDADADLSLAMYKSDKIEYKYAENFEKLFDLYINNSITKPTLLGSKSVADSMAEFALGKVAMIQNGNWAWSQISGVSGNTVKRDDIKMLPLYTGIDGEEKKEILAELLFRIEAVKAAEDKKYVLMNIPTDKLGEIIKVLPGMKSPTVMPLAQEGWSSVHTVLDQKCFWEIIGKLKAIGAEGILVLPIEKMIL